MKDLFDHTVLCQDCESPMVKRMFSEEGFSLRGWQCSHCSHSLYHPGDVELFKRFQRLKERDFNVKLRMIGNSFCISIPREIIYFADLEKEMDHLVRLCLEEPHKLTLFFHGNSVKGRRSW